ncbi:hypothetical protein [Adlercreutzia sp. ZJ242]|uniref:hypothetical protein n=1 Tax=Adlercreutzia sp. ZJ242 TaxID=2709409 RepID=UPI0013EAB79E|nr:hypothetical protein [Adlercreutzia sp. ZJ242]
MTDMTAGWCKDRVEELLLGSRCFAIRSVSDAIEACQCKLFVESNQVFLDPDSVSLMRESARSLFSDACRYVNTRVESVGVAQLFDEVEQQYLEQFWDLVEVSGAGERIDSGDLRALLAESAFCLRLVLRHKRMVSMFDGVLREVMLSRCSLSAELIVSSFACAHDSAYRRIFLPESLTNDDMDSIMIEYLEGERPNPNYVNVLANWPSSSCAAYNPSAHVRVRSRRKGEAMREEVFRGGLGLRMDMSVCIDMNQTACKGITWDRRNSTHTFSGAWLARFVDHATVMNNLIYIFDLVDSSGLIQMAAHSHEETGIMAVIGVRALDEYRDGLASRRRRNLAYLEVRMYADFLVSQGTRLESAMEWAVNEYFVEEYGVDGFSVALPSAESSYLDKCKAIGPEVERVLKAYVSFAENGRVDDAFFPFITIKRMEDVPSMRKRKYATAGDDFERWAQHLFSDQSMLSHPKGGRADLRSFFDHMLACNVSRADYADIYGGVIDRLIGNDFIEEDAETGTLLPTPRAVCLRKVWNAGAIVLKRYSTASLDLIDGLVEQDVLSYCDSLFAPDEASYLNFMLNDAAFSNSLGLRNRYDHASSAIIDPSSAEIEGDYYRLVTVLIVIILKVNEELMDATGKGGVDDFVDWEYYDESIFETLMRLVSSAVE